MRGYSADTETLESAAKEALKQINQKQYAQELKKVGIKNIKLLGIAFYGKQIYVVSKEW